MGHVTVPELPPDRFQAAANCRDVPMGRMLARGLIRHCPRCGSGGLFEGYFAMKEECPGCGYRFEQRSEEGFFLGALTINLGVTQGLVMLVLAVFIVMLAAGDGDVALAPILVPAGIGAVTLPILFYPFAKTIWAAVDCSLHRIGLGATGRPGAR